LEKERLTFDSTLKEILDEPLAVQMLNQYAPDLIKNPMIQFAYQLWFSETLANAPDETEQLFKMVINMLNQSANVILTN
jgi:alpha-L-rhamnosidase